MAKIKHAFKRLHELPKPTVAEVDQRLLAGEPASAVAKWLQTELQVFTDLKPESLKKNLERYRATDLKDRVLEDLKSGGKGKSTAALAKRLHALDEMEALVAIQKGRLNKVLLKETELPHGILLKSASDEARLLKETLVELGKLQLETGVLTRAPKKVSGTVFDPQTGETKEFAWTEEQEQLYRSLNDVDYRDVTDLPPMIEDASEHPDA